MNQIVQKIQNRNFSTAEYLEIYKLKVKIKIKLQKLPTNVAYSYQKIQLVKYGNKKTELKTKKLQNRKQKIKIKNKIFCTNGKMKAKNKNIQNKFSHFLQLIKS